MRVPIQSCLFYLFVFLLSVPFPVFADTIVDTDISEDTVWTKLGSPYLVQNGITIAQNTTLSIESGVEVLFSSGVYADVLGRLLVHGTSNEPVLLTSSARWGGIWFSNQNATSSLDNAVIQNAYAVSDYYSKGLSVSNTTIEDGEYGIEVYGGHLSLNNFSARNISEDAIVIGYGSDAILKNIVLENVDAGIELYAESSADISNLFIDRTHDEALALYEGSRVYISDSILTNGDGDGVGIYAGSAVDMRNSVISGFADGAGIVDYEYWPSDPDNSLSLAYNDIYGNGTGISMYSKNSSYAISNNSIHDNILYGFELYGTGNIDVSNNFWGDPSGPYNDSGNLAGIGDAIFYVPEGTVIFSPWLTSWGTHLASNVLFLPGIEASRLYRTGDIFGTDQLWEPNIESDVTDLFLTADGTSVRNDVYTKDVIDEKNVLPIGQGNIYESFIAQMDELKTAGTIADWEATPYDWRLTLDDILSSGNQLSDGRIYYSGNLAATTSPYLIQELRRLAKGSKTGKVTIVAHSNGGLVAKALTDKLGGETSTLIDKIIFVAVPQAGTPQAVGAILHGYDQGLPFDLFPLVLAPETARTFATNMPSAYNLLPSANYFTYVDNPIVTFDTSDFLAEFRTRYGNEIHDGTQLRNFIIDPRRLSSSSPNDLIYPSVGNATLLAKAEAVHGTLDTWTPPSGVSLYEIAGWGEDTLATIEYTEGKKTVCGNPSASTCQYYTTVPTLMYNPKEVIEGDGTVLVPSALWSSASTTQKYWVDLKKYNKFTLVFFATKHAEILEVPELRTLVQNILTNATSTPFTFITTTQPVADVTADKRLRFVLHSPLNLSATDNLGNIVNSTTSTIPGSRFKRYGEVQVLTVPKSTPVTLNLDGYAAGSFTLDMQEIDGINAVTASSTFSAIPSATSTKATMAFTDGTIQNASPLLLDYDGNGITDFSLNSKIGKTVVFDIMPPEAVVTFDPISQKLKIIGTDNLSNTTVSTAATGTTIADEAGNTLQILFKKLKQGKHELKLEVETLIYNGISTNTLSKTALQYAWSTDKTGKLKELEEKATVGALKIEGHYDAKKNVTKIEERIDSGEDKDEEENKKTLSGVVIIRLLTDNGKIGMSY